MPSYPPGCSIPLSDHQTSNSLAPSHRCKPATVEIPADDVRRKMEDVGTKSEEEVLKPLTWPRMVKKGQALRWAEANIRASLPVEGLRCLLAVGCSRVR